MGLDRFPRFILFMLMLVGCGEVGATAVEDTPSSSTPIIVTPPATEPVPTVASESQAISVFNETGNTLPTATPMQTATPLPTPAPKANVLNEWLMVAPPADWVVLDAPNGKLITQYPDAVQAHPFILVRRWGNTVGVDDWLNYLPDAQMEVGSFVATDNWMGRAWDGVFVRCPEQACRAFWGVTVSGSTSLSLLVYVPMPEGGAGAETLMASYDHIAPILNRILRTLEVQL